MKDYFSTLFTYDLWASQKIMDSLVKNKIILEKTTFWMSHILNAQTIWLDRILTGETQTSALTVYSLEVCTVKLLQENRRYQGYLSEATTNTFQQSISYQNSKGASFNSQVVDILAHVINHSTHHRAQIAAKIREEGFIPPATDYIFFKRR